MARILIIDDDAQIRVLLRQILEHEGYEVMSAADGKEGLKKFRQSPADLVITDLLLPEMAGSSVISKLCDEFPEAKIIAISGGGIAYGAKDYLNFAKELGAQCVIAKPFRREELLAVIIETLR